MGTHLLQAAVGAAVTFAVGNAHHVPTSVPQAPGAAEQPQQQAKNKVTLGVLVSVGRWAPALWLRYPFPDCHDMKQGPSSALCVFFLMVQGPWFESSWFFGVGPSRFIQL